jgi:hypothetical protein
MDVCVVFVVRTVVWNVKWHEGRKDLNSTKWIKGGKPRTGKKKNPTEGMDVYVVFVVRTVVWNVKWHEGRKDLNSTKMDQRGKTQDRQKKSHRGHGCLSLVCVVCCQVEVSATSWSLVQRSPTECVCVSNVCDHKTSTKRGGPGPYKAVEPYKGNILMFLSSQSFVKYI